jgi:putative DNA primase/helicase
MTAHLNASEPVETTSAGSGASISFADLLDELGHDTFTAIGMKPVGGEFSATVTDTADAAGMATVSDADVWFGVCPVEGPVRRGRGSADQVTALPALWADIDVKAGACADLGQAVDVIGAISEAIGSRPTVMIFSGHGFQPLWTIDDPEEAQFGGDAAKRERAATLLRRWGQLVRTVGAQRDIALDSVFDLARILRVPGTTNHKSEPTFPVVATCDLGRPLSFEEITDRLDELDIPDPATGGTLGEPVEIGDEWPSATCGYAATMIQRWTSDSPAARHPWLMSQAVRLTAARRLGCLTEIKHREGVRTLTTRMHELCAQGEARPVGGNEISDAFAWARGQVAFMTDERARGELGGHEHRPDNVTELTMTQASTITTAPAGVEVHRGQARMAYRLAADYRDRLLHVTGIGWHCWDGQRWAADDTGAATRAVLDVLKRAWSDARDDKDLAADVRKCESKAGIDGVLGIAGALTDFCATVRDLDADPYLLNTPAGTFDLRTGEIRPHSPADRITKVTRAAVADGADGSSWRLFLERVLPDAEVRAYLQRVTGVGLLGKVTEHILPILTGTGANGKSTFVNALLFALGDYASTVEPDLFLHRPGAHPTGEMDLRGRRVVVVSESEKDRRLAEATMKRLTGGDTIRARRMRQDFVEFEPSHTAVLVTNHLPKVSGDDPAIWRRLRVIPFGVEIPAKERDKNLDERLQVDAGSVLAWALAGWRDYRDRGDLDEPADVQVATDRYQKASDAVARFIEECCVTSTPALKATTSHLFKAWDEWRADDGTEAISQKAFGEALDRHGYPVTSRTKSGRWRSEIGLRVEVSDGEG